MEFHEEIVYEEKLEEGDEVSFNIPSDIVEESKSQQS
jgi:hypothetical protein